MALKLGELVAFLKTDDKQFQEGLDKGEKSFSKFGDKLKASALAFGAAAGATLAAGVASTMNTEAANDKLAAQLGLTGPESERIGKMAGDLYAAAYGDSLGTVNNAIRSVIQNVEGMSASNTSDLEGVTAAVLDVSTAFDQDLGGTTRAVGKLMKTGLAKDAYDALDLLTRGFQTGTNEADDLLDTVSEYSTKFRDIGLTGQQAMGLLSQGLAAGARDADTVADALKEFSIRAIDGSKTTADGFKALGLSGSKMAADIAAGGPRAAKALDTTLDRLRGIKDPVERNAAAVALFGTKAEDLGDALFALDPSSAVGALGEVTGASTRLGETLADNAQTRLETFKRKAQAALVEKLADAIPYVEGIVRWLEKHKNIVGPLAIGLGVLAGVIGTVVAITKVYTAAQTALNVVMAMNPIGLVIAAIAALIAIVVIIATKTDWFQRLWGWAWGGIKKAAHAVGSWFTDTLWPWIRNVFTWIGNAAGSAKDWIVGRWNALIGFFTGIPGRVSAATRTMWDGIKSGATSAKDWVTGKINSVVGFIGGLPGRTADIGRRTWWGLVDSARGALNWLIGKWNGLDFGIHVPSFLGFGGIDIGDVIPDIDYLAKGGVVPATRGGRLAVIGEGGEDEAVAPLSKLAGMLRDAVREGLADGGAGLTVEQLIVKAFSDRFSLDEVMAELAMHGVH